MNYEFKGTQGEWYAVEYAGHVTIQDAPFYGEKDLLDADNVSREIMTANGHVAAAAPELLQACIELEAILSPLTNNPAHASTMYRLYNAIHKALNISEL